MQNEEVKISGMSCGHCQAAVEKSIKALPGIISLEVLLKEGQARVAFDESKVSLQDIQASIEDAGYSVDK